MKKSLIISSIIIIIIIIGTIIFFNKIKKKDNDILKPIQTVSSIELDKLQYINVLEKIPIKDTNDYLTITKKVKWEVPDYGENATVTFSIPIPYTITVDGIDYKGIYELNDSGWNTPDNNPKYNFTVTNLTSNGDIEVMITTK